MKIIKATEAIPIEHPVFLEFGQPGIGKSSLGYSCKNPLLLDFDRGAHRAANRRDTLVIDSWEDVTALNQEVLEPYSALVVDTVGRCLDFIIADIAKTDPKKAPGGNLTQQGWGVLKNRFRQWMSTLRTMGKDVLLIAHDKEDKDGDLRIVRPDIVGGSYAEVMKIADFVGYVYMSGKQRVLDFNPTDRWVGKNPGNWTPIEIPAVGKAQHFMAELFDRGKEVLGKISETSASIAMQVDDWRAQIETLSTAEELNKAIPEIKTLKPAVTQSQVAALLMERASKLKISFDKEKRLFVVPEVVESVL